MTFPATFTLPDRIGGDAEGVSRLLERMVKALARAILKTNRVSVSRWKFELFRQRCASCDAVPARATFFDGRGRG